MTRIVIIAALADELRPLVQGWPRESHHDLHLWRRPGRGGDEWIAACAGMGAAAAARALDATAKSGAIDAVVSIGWAGALRPEFVAGEAYRVAGVIDARTGERFGAAPPSQEGCWVVTTDRVADQAEKRRLTAAYGAALVDMEAAGIARLAARNGIPFRCLKGVSDGVADQMPDFNRFISANGQFQRVRFILFAMLHPWHWAGLIRMGGNSRKAAQNLRKSLLDILDERETAEGRSGDSKLNAE